MQITITIPGTPQQRGSKIALPNRRTGRSILIDSNHSKSKPWMMSVQHEARQAMAGRDPICEPVQCEATFYYTRPKNHFRTGRHAGELKPDAPLYVAQTPDLDKILRCLGDAMSGTIYRDDRQIVSWQAIKIYHTTAMSVITVKTFDERF